MSFEIIVFDASGGRVSVPPNRFGSLSWTQELYGNFGEFSLPINAKTSEVASIAPGYRVEQWYAGVRLYRGYVLQRSRQIGTPDSLQLSGHGRMYNLSLINCTAPIVLPTTSDLSALVNQIITIWVRPVYAVGVLTLDINTTGVNINSYDCTNKSVKQVLDELCDLTGGLVYWGVDVDSNGVDRLYLRLLGQTTHVIAVPGRDVSAASGETDTSEITNRVRLTGGDMEYWRQNILPNASFEKTIASGSADNDGLVFGNLLQNPGFEIGGTHSGWSTNTAWVQVGAAAYKQNGGIGGDPNAYSGTWCVELSDGSEETYQIVSGIVPGHKYGIRAHMRPSDAFTTGTGHVLLEWYTSGLSLIRQDDMTVDVTSAAYQRFENSYIAPTGVASCEIRLICSSGNSIMYDAISFWDADVAVQQGWYVTQKGTGAVTMQWDATGAKEGVYCIKATVTGADNSGNNEVTIAPTASFPVVPGDRYSFYTWLKTVGIATHRGLFRMKFYDASGTLLDTFTYTFSGSGLASWTFGYIFGTARTQVSAPIIFGGTSITKLPASMTVEVVLQANGDWYMDACTLMNDRGILELFDGNGASNAPGDGTVSYLPDGKLSLGWNAQDLVTALEDSEVNGSQAAYGVRESRESVDSLVTYAGAKQFAKGYLRRRAKAQQKPAITVVGAERPVVPGDYVNLVGDDGANLSGGQTLPIARIRGSSDGAGLISQSLEIGRSQVTIEALLRKTSREEIARKK